jgi:hypothetical protein
MSQLSWRARNQWLSQKGSIRIQNVLISVGLIHLAVLYLAWRRAALLKALIGIGAFWLGLILLSALLTGIFRVLDKPKGPANRDKTGAPPQAAVPEKPAEKP